MKHLLELAIASYSRGDPMPEVARRGRLALDAAAHWQYSLSFADLWLVSLAALVHDEPAEMARLRGALWDRDAHDWAFDLMLGDDPASIAGEPERHYHRMRRLRRPARGAARRARQAPLALVQLQEELLLVGLPQEGGPRRPLLRLLGAGVRRPGAPPAHRRLGARGEEVLPLRARALAGRGGGVAMGMDVTYHPVDPGWAEGQVRSQEAHGDGRSACGEAVRQPRDLQQPHHRPRLQRCNRMGWLPALRAAHIRREL